MKQLFEFFAKRHLLANIVTFMTILLGLASIISIKRDVFPQVDFGELIITTVYPGASPEDVELNVTNKLEEELKEVVGIDRYTSFSMENISVIDVVIDPNAKDLDAVEREIRDAVNRVSDLPTEVEEAPSILEINTSIFPVIEIGLSGEVPYTELRSYAKRLEKRLEDVGGVSSVVGFGFRDREIQIEVEPGKMREYQISLSEIIRAIAGRNIRQTGGTFESYTSEKTVVTLAQFSTPQEVGDVIVRSTFDGPSITIHDLALVSDDFEDERIISRINGRNAISYIVNKKENADVIRTVDAVKALAAEFNEILPEGVEVLYSNDMSYYVRNRLQVVGNNGMIGLGLVILMLSLFLNIRSAFWVAMGIPVTVLGVLFLLPHFDSYLDVISMAAMIQVIGIIVDDGIIIAENIHSKREKGMAPLQAAVEGLSEVFWPVVATIVTTFIAFAPMFFMSGIMGKFIYVIPLVMSLALFVSLFEAIVALPAHLIWGLKETGKVATRSTRSWFDHIKAFYVGTMRYAILLRYLVVLVAFGALAGSLWYMTTKMEFVLFPSENADNFFILAELPTGSSLQATSQKMMDIEKFIAALPAGEVQSFVTRVGTQGDFQPGENENWALIGVYLTPFAKRDRIADDVVEELRAHTDNIDGIERLVYFVDSGGPPVGRPVTFRVVGSDDDVRQALADSVALYLAALDGVRDLDRNDKPGKDQIEIRLDYEKLARVGLTVADVAQNVRFAYDGEVVTDVRYGDEDVDFRVLLNDKSRHNPNLLAELLIPNPQGRLIALGSVARFPHGPGASSFYHYNGDRAITITSDVVQGVSTPVKATTALTKQFDLADWEGMRFVVGGEAEETQETMQSLVRAFIMAVIGIYFVLVLLFNSPTQPLIVMTAIPFGIMGVIVAFALHGADLGFLAMMGVVGLCGIVVNDSLVLVNHVNQLRNRDIAITTRDVVSQGAADRLRPVLLTTITTVVGLLPLAYGIGGSDPFIAPMALALGWGILFASPLTLLLVPCLYAISEDFSYMFNPRRRRAIKAAREAKSAAEAGQGTVSISTSDDS